MYFEIMRKAKKNGYHRLLIPDEYGGTLIGPLEFNIWCEELGWGSVGLATSIIEGLFPAAAASIIGTPQVIDEVVRPWMEDEGDKYDGCWTVMDPDRGSDYGASGIAQLYELATQLRGDAGPRQVEGARMALAENGGGFIGLGEAAMCVHILEKM